MDPLDYFIYEEFVDPGMKYECRQCGTRFGDECVTWNADGGHYVAVCPGCGSRGVLTDEVDDGRE